MSHVCASCALAVRHAPDAAALPLPTRTSPCLTPASPLPPHQDYVIRILQPTGTTPAPPPRASGSGSGGHVAASASSPALTTAEAASHSASCSTLQGGATAASATAAGGSTAAGAATAYGAHGPSPLSRTDHLQVRLATQSAPHPAQQPQLQLSQLQPHHRHHDSLRAGGGGSSGSCSGTPRSSRNGYLASAGGLVGVEPGLTVRARGFRCVCGRGSFTLHTGMW